MIKKKLDSKKSCGRMQKVLNTNLNKISLTRNKLKHLSSSQTRLIFFGYFFLLRLIFC